MNTHQLKEQINGGITRHSSLSSTRWFSCFDGACNKCRPQLTNEEGGEEGVFPHPIFPLPPSYQPGPWPWDPYPGCTQTGLVAVEICTPDCLVSLALGETKRICRKLVRAKSLPVSVKRLAAWQGVDKPRTFKAPRICALCLPPSLLKS